MNWELHCTYRPLLSCVYLHVQQFLSYCHIFTPSGFGAIVSMRPYLIRQISISVGFFLNMATESRAFHSNWTPRYIIPLHTQPHMGSSWILAPVEHHGLLCMMSSGWTKLVSPEHDNIWSCILFMELRKNLSVCISKKKFCNRTEKQRLVQSGCIWADPTKLNSIDLPLAGCSHPYSMGHFTQTTKFNRPSLDWDSFNKTIHLTMNRISFWYSHLIIYTITILSAQQQKTVRTTAPLENGRTTLCRVPECLTFCKYLLC